MYLKEMLMSLFAILFKSLGISSVSTHSIGRKDMIEYSTMHSFIFMFWMGVLLRIDDFCNFCGSLKHMFQVFKKLGVEFYVTPISLN